jgi:hypothetical protein
MFLVRIFFLFPNQAFAQLDLSYFATSFLAYSLNLMARRPGFLRAGRYSDSFVCWETNGIGCPAVSVSCLGGTTGIINSHCNLILII